MGEEPPAEELAALFCGATVPLKSGELSLREKWLRRERVRPLMGVAAEETALSGINGSSFDKRSKLYKKMRRMLNYLTNHFQR